MWSIAINKLLAVSFVGHLKLNTFNIACIPAHAVRAKDGAVVQSIENYEN